MGVVADGTATITFASLGDLTGVPEHHQRPLPEIWVDLLIASFDGVESTDEEQTLDASKQQALLPGTRVVIKLKPFMIDLVRGTAGIWLMLATTTSTHPAWYVWTAASLLDACRRMKGAIERLDELQGEACTYAATVRAGDFAIRHGNGLPDASDVWDAHLVTREGCPVATCQHHDGLCCRAKRDDIDVVIERLLSRGVLERKGAGLWPTT